MKAISINVYEIENDDGETMVFMTPEEFDFIKKQNDLKDKEIERLNNIINELEKWLNERKVVYNITREDRDIDYTIIEVLEKLQELKGEDKE